MTKEISPVLAVLIIVVLAGIAAGAYFFINRPRGTYDPAKASAAAASRGSRAFQSMSGASGGQVPSGGMGYSGGTSGGMGYSGGYSGGQPMSGGYRR